MWDMEKTEVLSYFLWLKFTSKCSHHTTKVTKGKGSDWENEPPTVGENQVLGHQRNLKVQKSM